GVERGGGGDARVRDRRRRIDKGLNRQPGRAQIGDRPDRPGAVGRVVGPLGRRRAHERQGTRQKVLYRDVVGRVRTLVRQGQREGNRVPDIRGRVIDRLREYQVGLSRRFSGARLVVARVGVELVGVADGGRVRLGVWADHPTLDQQGLRCRGGHSAYGPVAGSTRVGALAGGGRNERQPGRQQVLHLDVGGRVGPLVGEGDGK